MDDFSDVLPPVDACAEENDNDRKPSAGKGRAKGSGREGGGDGGGGDNGGGGGGTGSRRKGGGGTERNRAGDGVAVGDGVVAASRPRRLVRGGLVITFEGPSFLYHQVRPRTLNPKPIP
jgi:hypothetical protein